MDLLEEYKKCFGKFNYVNNVTDTEYGIFIDKKKKHIDIKFQGSGSTKDWVQNFRFSKLVQVHLLKSFLKKPYKSTFFFVHTGINIKYNSVKKEIHNIIDSYLEEGYTVSVHGFSQGGGLTYVAHEDIWYFLNRKGLDTDKLVSYAFAPLMIFGIFSSKSFKKRFKNFTVIKNVNDVVPKVPGFIFGYKHYGTVIKIGKKKLVSFPWNWTKEHLGYKDLL